MPSRHRVHAQTSFFQRLQDVTIPPAPPDIIALRSIVVQEVVEPLPGGASVLKQQQLAAGPQHLRRMLALRKVPSAWHYHWQRSVRSSLCSQPAEHSSTNARRRGGMRAALQTAHARSTHSATECPVFNSKGAVNRCGTPEDNFMPGTALGQTAHTSAICVSARTGLRQEHSPKVSTTVSKLHGAYTNRCLSVRVTAAMLSAANCVTGCATWLLASCSRAWACSASVRVLPMSARHLSQDDCAFRSSGRSGLCCSCGPHEAAVNCGAPGSQVQGQEH